jgi:3-hydroxyacyl-CoA dehydrogenase
VKFEHVLVVGTGQMSGGIVQVVASSGRTVSQDLTGPDACVAVMEVLHQGPDKPTHASRPLLRPYVQPGRLGRKAGRGFYAYS